MTSRRRAARPPAPAPAHGRRSARDDLLNLWAGRWSAAFAITLLLFGSLAPLSGPLGFVVVAWVMFLVDYALLVSLTTRPDRWWSTR